VGWKISPIHPVELSLSWLWGRTGAPMNVYCKLADSIY